MKNLRRALKLFLDFVKISCFTFGGGWSIVAQIQNQYVEKEKTLTNQELLDITSIGRSLPGIMICNISFLFGYHEAGISGGFACLFGIVLSPFVILSFVTIGYTRFQGNPYVARAMYGVRAAVVPIIATAMYRIMKGAYKYPVCVLVTLIGIAMYLFFNFNCILIVLTGAVLGLLISSLEERRSMDDPS